MVLRCSNTCQKQQRVLDYFCIFNFQMSIRCFRCLKMDISCFPMGKEISEQGCHPHQQYITSYSNSKERFYPISVSLQAKKGIERSLGFSSQKHAKYCRQCIMMHLLLPRKMRHTPKHHTAKMKQAAALPFSKQPF